MDELYFSPTVNQRLIVQFIHRQTGQLKGRSAGLAQDCSNAIALAMELLQSCAKPLIWTYGGY